MICVVCLFGLLASNNHWSEVLVKASVQRISSFVAILLVPFLMYRVFQDLRVGAYGYALLGGSGGSVRSACACDAAEDASLAQF